MQDTWSKESVKFSNLYLYKKICDLDKTQMHKWKMIALGSLVIMLISLCIMFYALNLPRTVPLVITVSDWGEARYVGEVNKLSFQGLKIPKIAIEYQLRRFITNRFNISTDANVIRGNLKDCYSCLTSNSAQKLSEELKADNPLKLVGKLIKNVEIESILTLSKNSYQVDFILTSSSLTGRMVETERLRGVLSVETLEPNEEDMKLNPLGIYITNFDFTKLVK